MIVSPKGHGFKPRTLNQVLDILLNKRRIIDPVTGCWIDTGTIASRKGYKKVYYNRRWIYTSRFMWEIHTGSPPPADKMVCHKCDNPPCFNPDHLFLGTNTENQHDMIRKGRARHPHSDELATKLTSENVTAMRSEYAKGDISFRLLGQKYGVSKTHARSIITRRKWMHVK